jgi:3-deoxy-7-phosphoheptulonate synthase
MAANAWHPGSWRQRTALQQPTYPDPDALDRVLALLRQLPPIVPSGEVEALRKQMAEVEKGVRFLIQGGDCSERFDECRPATIVGKLKVILQMGLILLDASKMKVVRVARMAGQYAKPRSKLEETREGVTLPSYQGDLVNRPGFTAAERTPDPANLLAGYQYSGITLNFVRGLVGGDFSNLDYPDYWDLGFAERSPHAETYRAVVARLSDSLRFLEASVGAPLGRLTRTEVFTSHEALILPYEEALTRKVPFREGWFNQSTHFPWIGDRTRALDGAHVEYMRGIQNPVGVKISASIAPEELVALLERLNPAREPGKVMLIHRFGKSKIAAALPPLIEAVQRSERSAVWCCDPMHGNTITTAAGHKTRSFDDILDEVRSAFEIHHDCGTFLGGVHFELTGDDVTECIGGARALSEHDLHRAYNSLVDPRLNQEQALEAALQVGQVMRKWAGAMPTERG